MNRENDQPRPTPKRIRDHVAGLIAKGQFGPGDRLPTERVLAETLAASRNTVRDGLMLLESEGAVRRLPGSGTYVAPDAAAAADATWTPRQSSPRAIMEARLTFEPRLARLAALNATLADLDRLAAIHNQSLSHAEGAGFEPLDAELHAAIATATQNRLLMHLYAEVTAARDQAIWGELKQRSGTVENRRTYMTEHATLVDAIRRRDPDAAEQAALLHLRSVHRHMLGE